MQWSLCNQKKGDKRIEILNTIQGHAFTNWTFLGYLSLSLIIFGLLFLLAGASVEFVSGAIFGIILLVIGFVMMFTVSIDKPNGKFAPTRYEIKITDPNYVIDATKYRVIEKRDKIIELEEIKQ